MTVEGTVLIGRVEGSGLPLRRFAVRESPVSGVFERTWHFLHLAPGRR